MLDDLTERAPPVSPRTDAWMRDTRDALHSVATLYLRHRDAARALTLLLTALHLTQATRPLLLATAAAFLDVGQAEQALAALERSERDFGTCRAGLILKARTVMVLDGLEAGQALMQDALSLTPEEWREV